MQNPMHQEILALMPAIRAVVAMVLRNSRYYESEHIDECAADIMLVIFDYGIKTFDPSRGSAKSHFTTLAKCRALNWLHVAHRRFDHGADADIVEALPAVGDPFASLARAREAGRIREAFAALEPRQRALLAAFERLHSWGKAAREIGVSAATASRMKAEIAEQLR